MPTNKRVCKDCQAEGLPLTRKASYPGPRCATHHRKRKKDSSEASHAKHLLATYGITPDEYQAIYEHQGGKCYICQRATGARKRLAVDHDHETGYVRGLLCGTCNRRVLGHLRDDPEAFERGKQYLLHPPAFDVIGKRVAPIEKERKNGNHRNTSRKARKNRRR